MSSLQEKKSTRCDKRGISPKRHCKPQNQTDIAEILHLSDGESEITNMLLVLMKKWTTRKNRQVIYAKRWKRIKNQREMLKMKSTLTEMKTAFDRLTSRLGMVKERIGELEEPSQKLPKLKLKKVKECPRTVR